MMLENLLAWSIQIAALALAGLLLPRLLRVREPRWQLRYYQAARTRSGIEFLFPIHVSGTRIASQHPNGRRYVIVYFMTQWGRLAASGYWLDPKQGFGKVYVTDVTVDDLEMVAEDLEELSQVDPDLDNILNRTSIELDMEVWSTLLAADKRRKRYEKSTEPTGFATCAVASAAKSSASARTRRCGIARSPKRARCPSPTIWLRGVR